MIKQVRLLTLTMLALLFCTFFGMSAFAAVEIGFLGADPEKPYFETNKEGFSDITARIVNNTLGIVSNLEITASDLNVLVSPSSIPSITSGGDEDVLLAVAFPKSNGNNVKNINIVVKYKDGNFLDQQVTKTFSILNTKESIADPGTGNPGTGNGKPEVPMITPPPPPTIEFVKAEKSAVQVEGGMRVPSGDAGERVILDLPLIATGFYQLTDVYIRPKYSSDLKEYPFSIESTDETRRIGSLSPGARSSVSFDFLLNPKVTTGSHTVKFVVGYTEHQIDTKGNVKVVQVESEIAGYVEVINGYKEDEKPLEQGAIVIASVDDTGKSITTPAGNMNDKVQLILPLKNRGGKLTNIEVIPETSADQKDWPFKITTVNLGRSLDDMDTGDTVTLKYDFVISDKAVSGLHPVTFNCVYRENDQAASCKVVAYVNVVKGAPETTPVPTEKPDSQPKILISSYQFEPQSIFAGDSFKLSLEMRNTSSARDILNLSMVFKNSDGIIMPSPGASNALYFKRIAAGDTVNAVLEFNVRPNAENKPYMLDVAMDYEDVEVQKYTSAESISVPVALKTRVTIDEPRASAEGAMLGSTVPVTFQIVNMGKAQLYNVLVKVESESFEMEESYFGGNIVSGATLRVDFNVLPLVAGKLKGDVVVKYENEYGEETSKTMPLEFELMEDMPMPEMPMDPGMMMPEEKKMGWGQIAAIAGGALVLVIIVVVIIKKRIAKKRERELNDDLD